MAKKLIAQGAEARIYHDGSQILKDRFEKHYRIPEIDRQLRKRRTLAESRLLEKVAKIGIPAPKVVKKDEQAGLLVMEQIAGRKLRDVLNRRNAVLYGKRIGALVAKLHEHNIIHGDLTTSNMITNKDGPDENRLFFVDFGLGFVSTRIEDKAVDLHLLRQALESKHSDCWQQCFRACLHAYNTYRDAKEVLARFGRVEARGRNKEKY